MHVASYIAKLRIAICWQTVSTSEVFSSSGMDRRFQFYCTVNNIGLQKGISQLKYTLVSWFRICEQY